MSSLDRFLSIIKDERMTKQLGTIAAKILWSSMWHK
jgi:hypothetical protein